MAVVRPSCYEFECPLSGKVEAENAWMSDEKRTAAEFRNSLLPEPERFSN